MNADLHSLVIPLTFPSSSLIYLDESRHAASHALIEIGCSTSKPSALASWRSSEHREISTGLPAKGAVLGCEDGTLYVFHSNGTEKQGIALQADAGSAVFWSNTTLPDSLRVSSHTPRSASSSSGSNSLFHKPHSRFASGNNAETQDIALLSDDISPLARSNAVSPTPPDSLRVPSHPPRSASSSGFHSPFHIVPHSRVVSGITAEKVEAPRNYVDFEDEPEKLKDILEGRPHKDKALSDSPPHAPEGADLLEEPRNRSHQVTTQNSVSKHNDKPKSLLSATNSPAFTPKSISQSPSPRVRTSVPPFSPNASSGPHDLSLMCHIIPHRSGHGRSVTGLQTLPDRGLFVVLHATG
jgi:WD repeat-containing protein 7